MSPALAALLSLACAPKTQEAPAEPVPEAPGDRFGPAHNSGDADLIYFILVDRYADGAENTHPVDPADPQGWHGGDLQGVIDHLDDIHELGARTIWLSPIFQARHEKFFEWGAFHGYWVEDIGAIDPRFGDLETLAALSNATRARGMRLVLDVVWNHVAMEAPLVEQQPGWFHEPNGIEDWDDPHQLVNHEVHGLPDLAQERPEVYDHLLQTSLAWLPYADGFRVDAVRHMPNDFLAKIDGDLKAEAPDLWMLGEIFDGDPVGLARDFQAGAFDAVFDFPLRYAMIDVFCGGRSAGRLASTLAADRLYHDPSGLVTFLDNHDVSRVWSECGEDPAAVGRALDFMLTTRGVPAITWGTEAGLAGMEEPHNRADMDFTRRIFNDQIREKMAERSLHTSLTRGETRLLTVEDELLVYARVAPKETAWIAVNLSDQPQQIAWPEPWTAPPGQVTARFSEGPGPEALEGARSIAITAAGDDPLWLVGAGPELGNWDPAAALPLTDGALSLEYPAGAVMEFKLIRKDGGAVTWEDGENRFVLVGDAGAEVQVAWGERAG